MERLTKDDTTRLLRAMQGEGMDVTVVGRNGGLVVENRAGTRTLSPLTTRREIHTWLYAYREGWWDSAKVKREVLSGTAAGK